MLVRDTLKLRMRMCTCAFWHQQAIFARVVLMQFKLMLVCVSSQFDKQNSYLLLSRKPFMNDLNRTIVSHCVAMRGAFIVLLTGCAVALFSLVPARAVQAQGTSQSASYSDLWWNPAESGWGINLNQQGDTIFATWFTYGDGGRNAWYVMSDARKQADGSYTGAIYQTTGVPYAQINGQKSSKTVAEVGTGTFRFSASNAATFNYKIGAVDQTKGIVRQQYKTTATVCTQQPPVVSRAGSQNYQDLWYIPTEDGWGINITHQENTLFATWFTYDGDGQGVWFVASDVQRQYDGTFTGDVFRTTGTPLAQINNAAVTASVTKVGQIRFFFNDGVSGEMAYDIGGVQNLKQIVRQTFSSVGVNSCTNSASIIPAYKPSYALAQRCIAPRTGNDPTTNRPWPDVQGTLADEQAWLRSWSDETYLWYKDIGTISPASFATPVAYFNVLRSFEVTQTGRQKDQFHFSQTTAASQATSAGVVSGYGIQWAAFTSAPPRRWVVALVQPGSPAAIAGVLRGAELVSINGVDFVNDNTQAGVSAINAGLSPAAVNTTATYGLRLVGATAPQSFAMVSAVVNTISVQNVRVIESNNKRVGYMTFNQFIRPSEAQLVAGFTELAAQNVNELVLDLRYNGGGLLAIAGQLGYMIAGATRTNGKAFDKLLFNDKNPFNYSSTNATPFYPTTIGFSLTAGTPLPALNLSRVVILTSAGSCSASEAVINGLRGVDVKVDLIGATTCGKPYGFLPRDNCGTTYNTIQFSGSNHKGFGDYADGFAATCSASDDFSKQLGDPTERQLAAALSYIATGVCVVGDQGMSEAKEGVARLVRDPAEENRVYDKFIGTVIGR